MQPLGIALQGDRIIDKIDNQHSENNRELVPRHQVSPAIGRSHLGDIHGRDHRSEANTNTTQDTVSDKMIHESMVARPRHTKEHLWPGRANSGEQEKNGSHHQRRLTSITLAKPSGERRSQDTANQGATDEKALQGTRLSDRQAQRLDKIDPERLDSSRDHGRIVSEQEAAQSRDQRDSKNIIVVFHETSI